MMKLYKITRTESTDYDEVAGFVIAASNEDEVRELAAEQCGVEGAEAWDSPRRTTLVHLGTALKGTEAGVIIRDYLRG
jgi:hypothetical protein